MTTDLTHLVMDHDSAEEIANAVQDDLTAHLKQYPGTATSPESIGMAAYEIVMTAFGHGEDDEED